MSLRVLAEGIAALMFVQVFSAGSSVGFEQAPFFLAAGVSLTGLAVRVIVLLRRNTTVGYH